MRKSVLIISGVIALLVAAIAIPFSIVEEVEVIEKKQVTTVNKQLLSESKNSAMSVRNEFSQARLLFETKCSRCHGENAEGSHIAPPLDNPELRKKGLSFLRNTITNGRRGTFMRKWGATLDKKEIDSLANLIYNWDKQIKTELFQLTE